MNSNGGSSFFGSDWLGAFLIIAILNALGRFVTYPPVAAAAAASGT